MIKQEYYDEFADKQVVAELIGEIQIQKNILKKLVIRKHNNLVDKFELFKKQNMDNLICLKKEVNCIKENKDRIDFAGEQFIKLGKVEKNTKINNANIHLLEMRIDNIDKCMQILMKDITKLREEVKK